MKETNENPVTKDYWDDDILAYKDWFNIDGDTYNYVGKPDEEEIPEEEIPY